MESLLGDALGHTWFFKNLPEDISFYAFAKDKSFDLLKDKLTEGIGVIFKKAKNGVLKKVDVEIIKDYVSSQCGKVYEAANQFIQRSRRLVPGLSLKYADALAIKSKILANSGKMSAEECHIFFTQFSHDPEAKIFEKFYPFLRYKEGNEGALKDFDVDYIRQYLTKKRTAENNHRLNTILNALQERKDFLIAKDKNTVDAWRNFLANYPNKPFAGLIQQHIEILQQNEDLQAAISSNDRSGWQEFLNKHPNHPDHEMISAWIQQNDFSTIHTEPLHFAPVNEFRMPPVAEEEGILMSILEHIRI